MTQEPIRILIVEDHMITRLGLRMVLEERPGFVVVGEAEDGNSALKKIAELTPDVVLLDIGLPQIDGIECLTKVRARKLNSYIMMRSSHEEDAAILSALGAGADGYCLKDTSDKLLMEGIVCLAHGRAWLDPRIAQHLVALFSGARVERYNAWTHSAKNVTLLEQELALLNQIARSASDSATRVLLQDEFFPDKLRQLMRKIGELARPHFT